MSTNLLPHRLKGIFYCHGPARLEQEVKRFGHWLDKDGVILAVHVSNKSATATYRYVQIKGKAIKKKLKLTNVYILIMA